MNKLEWEMSKSRLEFHKELCEEMVKMDKNILWLNGIVIGLCTPIAIFAVAVSVGYMKDGEWLFAIIEFLLAPLNGCLVVNAICRGNITKRSLKRNKDELEQIDSAIELLEGVRVE